MKIAMLKRLFGAARRPLDRDFAAQTTTMAKNSSQRIPNPFIQQIEDRRAS
jgi:hypothetical protein